MSQGTTIELMTKLIIQSNKAHSLLLDVLKHLKETQCSDSSRPKRNHNDHVCDCLDESSNSLTADDELLIVKKREADRRDRESRRRSDRKRDLSHSRGRSRGHSRGRSHGRSRSRSLTNAQHRQLSLAVEIGGDK